MSTELPIACSLSAGELHVRQAQIADLGRDALVEARVEAGHADLHFKGGAAVRDRVERFVAAESECCPFLTMGVEETPNEVRLIIDAPDGAEPVLEELVAAFRSAPQAA
jgi:hypothetical protein